MIEVNERQHRHIVDKVRTAVGELDGAEIAVLGLTFKANTDDLRDSPALSIARRLVGEGARRPRLRPRRRRARADSGT